MTSIYTISIIATVAVAAIFNPVYGQCGFERGEDVCNDKRCTPLVVRPMDVPKPSLPTSRVVCKTEGAKVALTPIGGPCSFQATVIKPAVVPKPQCLFTGRVVNGQVMSNQQFDFNQNQRLIVGGGDRRRVVSNQANLMPNTANPANLIAADPVSLAAAYDALHNSACNAHIKEDTLSFGFRKLPVDMPLYRKKSNNIREEDLHILNGQVVELKKVSPCSSKTLAEEAAEDLLENIEDEEDEQLANENLKRLSLGEIGYAPAKLTPAKFVNVEIGDPEELAIEQDLEPPCNDGFRAGSVLRQEVPHQTTILTDELVVPWVVEVEEPPQEEEEDGFAQLGFPQATSGCGCNGRRYQFSSSSSKSSSSSVRNSNRQQSVFLEKLSD